MKALFYTNEYPPYIYGGAGVHVDYLTRELAKLMNVEIRCFGDQNVTDGKLQAKGFPVDESMFNGCPKPLKSPFGAIYRGLGYNGAGVDANVVHCHTWYTHFGGVLTKLTYGIPLVITVHSLEPLRPWKREQIGGGYEFSCWVEKTALEMADAVIAVSRETARDIKKFFNVKDDRLHIIYNGIDSDEYTLKTSKSCFEKFGINPNQPYVLFVGRITRQKGIIHLVNAIKYLDKNIQVVLCAGAPDTPEIAAEMEAGVNIARQQHNNIVWIREMVDKPTVIELYSNAAVFCCPSIYEPFGIINLEAMACETPVVASAVGGIKEVVVEGETGFLVKLDQMDQPPFEALNPDQFARDLAAPINKLMADEKLRQKMGKAGRDRALSLFSWKAIAKQVAALYSQLSGK